MLDRLRARKEWKFFAVLPQAAPGLAAAWWTVLLLRGILPAAFAIAMGVLVGAVQHSHSLAGPLTFAGAIFVLLQVLSPIHQALSANLGDSTAAWLYDRLTEACVRPPGIGHLEDPALTSDLTVARDFDLGMTGPPLSISMDFIAAGMVEMVGGLASAVILVRYAWWAPLLLAGAWLATHWLLRESGVWYDRQNPEVRAAQRDADYAYRLAVDPPASKELRLFGLAGWTIDRFVARRTRLHELQYAATRLRERPVLWSLLLVVSANVLVFWMLAFSVSHGHISLGEAVVYVQSAIGVSMIAFGGLSWALDGSAAPVAAVLRLEPAMRPTGALRSGVRRADQAPQTEIRLRDVTFAYPAASPVLEHFDLTIPAGTSLAIVGRTAPARPPSPSCCAASTIRNPAPSPSTALICESSILRPGARASRPCSRTLSAWSCRCAKTWPLAEHPTRWSKPRSPLPERPAWPRSTPSWPAVTAAEPTCPVASGSAWRSPGLWQPSRSAPGWCCSMSPRPSSTCAGKRRSSIACWPPLGIAPPS